MQLFDSDCGVSCCCAALQVARLLGQRRRYVALFNARAQHMATPEDYQVCLPYTIYRYFVYVNCSTAVLKYSRTSAALSRIVAH
jgi:hypothetical protein